MKEARYFYVPEALTANELPQDEASHAVRVLRLSEGDEMFLMDGEGTFHRAEVTMAHGKRCSYKIIESLPQEKIWRNRIHIAMAPTKMMERVEWFAEKATEIGCDEYSFLLCKFSERKQMREDRVEKTVVSAAKQSRKAWMPKVNALTDFEEFINEERDGGRYICHCYDEVERVDFYDEIRKEENQDKDITVLIGPEGDFSIDEVRMALDKGYKSVSLGNARLRTETAALSAVMMSQLAKRN